MKPGIDVINSLVKAVQGQVWPLFSVTSNFIKMSLALIRLHGHIIVHKKRKFKLQLLQLGHEEAHNLKL